jgi:hypothetical protein
MPFEPGGGIASGGIPPFFMFFFLLIAGVIIFQIVKGIGTWSHNNQQPVLSVSARIVSKRVDVSRHQHAPDSNGHVHHGSSTTYYTTFEVESGDRMEFRVSGQEYGLLAEGDEGKLTFQGSRYHGFDRIR